MPDLTEAAALASLATMIVACVYGLLVPSDDTQPEGDLFVLDPDEMPVGRIVDEGRLL